MKVAIVTDTYHPNVNGVVKTLSVMEAYFKDRTPDCRIFHPGIGNKADAGRQSFFSVSLPIYPEIRMAMVPYLYFRAVMDDWHPDVLHIVTQGPLGRMAAKYAAERQVPYLASYTTDFSGYLSDYKLELLSSKLERYLKEFHTGAVMNLAPSSHSIRQLQRMGIHNVSKWGRGIDTGRFNPDRRSESFRAAHLEGASHLLLYCGRLAKEKRVDVLLDMMAELNGRRSDIRLLVAGDGPCRRQLEERRTDNVSFLGFLEGEALAEAYASSDLFVFASEKETFGNVILEAFASGLPVVAIHKGGVTENLLHLDNGIAIQDNLPSHYANAVEMLIDNPAFRERLGANALAHARNKDWGVLIDDLEARYAAAHAAAGRPVRTA